MNKKIKTPYKYKLVVGQHILNTLMGKVARFEVTKVISDYEYEIKFIGFDLDEEYDNE